MKVILIWYDTFFEKKIMTVTEINEIVFKITKL